MQLQALAADTAAVQIGLPPASCTVTLEPGYPVPDRTGCGLLVGVAGGVNTGVGEVVPSTWKFAVPGADGFPAASACTAETA